MKSAAKVLLGFVWVVSLTACQPAIAGIPPTQLEDEGVRQGVPVWKIDCVGPDIACTHSNVTGTITATGAAVVTGWTDDGTEVRLTTATDEVEIGSAGAITATLGVTGDVIIIHTATEADNNALEVDVDAAGFGDVKGLEIEYDTGAIATGQDEAIILININELDATGGEVFGLEVLATDGAADKITAVKAGALVGPILQDSGVFINATLGTNNTNSTNVPDMIDGSTGTNTDIFILDDDFIIIGSNTAVTEIEVVIETGAGAPGIKPTFAYSTAGTNQFTDFSPVDGSNGFKNAGAFVIAWDASDLTGHVADTVTGKFDIRMTRTANNTSTVSLFFAKTAATTVFSWDKNGVVLIDELQVGNSGTLTAKSSIDGDTDEIQLLVQAHSTQTSDLVVFEQSDGTNIAKFENDGDVTWGDGSSFIWTMDSSSSTDPTFTMGTSSVNMFGKMMMSYAGTAPTADNFTILKLRDTQTKLSENSVFYGLRLNQDLTFTAPSSSSMRGIDVTSVYRGTEAFNRIRALSFTAQHSGSNTMTELTGIRGITQALSTGGVTDMFGVKAFNILSGGADATDVFGLHSDGSLGSGSVATNWYGLFIGTPSNSGTITNQWGVFVEDPLALNVFEGDVIIGNSTKLAKLGVDGDADEIQALIQGHSTQTSSLLVLEQSDGTDSLIVSNLGAVTLTTTAAINFGDTGTKINQSTDGQLDIDGDVEVEIATATFDVNASTASIFSSQVRIEPSSAQIMLLSTVSPNGATILQSGSLSGESDITVTLPGSTTTLTGKTLSEIISGIWTFNVGIEFLDNDYIDFGSGSQGTGDARVLHNGTDLVFSLGGGPTKVFNNFHIEDADLKVDNIIQALDKVVFTQTDENDYIDSENDGDIDIVATTSVDITAGGAEQGVWSSTGLAIIGEFTSSKTDDLGWTAQSAANQACNTTCTSACVVGLNNSDLGHAAFVGCTSATADVCLCAGAS